MAESFGACCGESRSLNHSTLIIICETREAENQKPDLTLATASPELFYETAEVALSCYAVAEFVLVLLSSLKLFKTHPVSAAV
jgi:hypothetical protein